MSRALNRRKAFYRKALLLLSGSNIPFLVGGAYALALHTGIRRDTKDLDIFVLPRDCPRALDLFARRGYKVELAFTHWLGKVFLGKSLIDVIFSSGNGLCRVDESWFLRAMPGNVLGVPVKIKAPEEMIWSKAFIMERKRYDGADIAHLLRSKAEEIDWEHLMELFGEQWQVLLSHLALFAFIYPSEWRGIPTWVVRELSGRLLRISRTSTAHKRACRGTLLSNLEYVSDVEEGYCDARLIPMGKMTRPEVSRWYAAFVKN